MISPLEQVKDLIIEALRSQKALRYSFVAFFIEAVIGVLTICGRVNFSQLARYGKSCEQRFRQNFRKTFDWLSFNRSLVDKQPGHRYAIAIDLFQREELSWDINKPLLSTPLSCMQLA